MEPNFIVTATAAPYITTAAPYITTAATTGLVLYFITVIFLFFILFLHFISCLQLIIFSVVKCFYKLTVSLVFPS